MSTDHKATDEKEASRVISEKGTIFRNRLGGVLAVTRALGDFELKDDVKYFIFIYFF
jgi:protein phosphatase PTC1